jgi:hypothetical protein
MKKVAFLALLTLAAAVSSCGTRTPTTTVENTTSGYWEAELIGGTGPTSQLNFVTQFNVTNVNGSTEPLDITGFSFINSQSGTGACFPSVSGWSGSIEITVLSTNQVTGSLTYTITSSAGNQLALTTSPNGGVSGTANGTAGTIGTLSNGVAWGNWTLTGPCASAGTPQGAFIMCQNTNTCSIP